ncbi:MAG: radical SAM protein [Anaerolineae bacterium]|jgi:biotin synthase-related radical SAM superfamily protein|nr:radical SAM protein [Chloroflexota bacterium]
MLRTGLAPATWRLSSGTAALLGLRPAALQAAPTTAYLMLGDRCVNNCAFCAQARSSTAHSDALSRVLWPVTDRERVIEAVARGYARGDLRRACFQVTGAPDDHRAAIEACAALAAESSVPICVSVAATDVEVVGELLQAGAQRVSLALDAATPELYARIKGRSWEHAWQTLLQAAQAYPGRIGTHLIAGLGESEREVIELGARLLSRNITIALFAFTPVRGTAMEHVPAPDLPGYRRVQAALWLLREARAGLSDFLFDASGRLRAIDRDETWLRASLAGGDAFRTSGCPDCNRPFYNERPGTRLYNYPCPLTETQAQFEIDELASGLYGPQVDVSKGAHGKTYASVF